MRSLLSFLMVALAFVTPFSAQAPMESQHNSNEMGQRVVRLPPADFKELPGNVVHDLERRHCTIPQETGTKVRTNVVRGEFQRPGQEDWAVLCSLNGFSSILVFWRGSESNPAEIARAEDRAFLQDMGEQKIDFSRLITPVGRDFIMLHYRAYGGPTPPPINHQGIDDGCTGKASVTYYHYKGKWYRLTGAD